MVDVGHSKDNQHEDEEEPGTQESTDKAAAEQESSDAADSGAEESPKAKKKPRSFWKELPILIGIAIVLTIIIQSFIARVFLIPSESMERTLHGCAGCYGDRVLVDRVVYAFSDPEPGDVVVFERPETWNRAEFQADRSSNTVVRWLQDIGAMFGLASPNEDDVVKRVIAVGGQTVECCDEQGRVQVDGRPLDEPYIYWADGAPNGNQEFDAFQVPQGTLWVMGDNRNNSADSRVQGGGGLQGVVPVDNVIGKARFIVLPPSRWQGVGDHNPQVALAWAGAQFGVGLLVAAPTLWLGRRMRTALRRQGRRP
ncbi:MAG TPA: signal peptidase I [Actinophytocola sp.]|uniref:signal peptidase I n=1 Tax=Actinophytocola sp. TaxID=1872138 RepID=UPI002DDD8A62|nr:signal peptidase I [Actinophytocola sp.]HEV2783492.1 signal peptidase I [Actinophytocola sp.]